MATDSTTPMQSLPLVVECEESKEEATLPTLTEWRQAAAGTLQRPRLPALIAWLIARTGSHAHMR